MHKTWETVGQNQTRKLTDCFQGPKLAECENKTNKRSLFFKETWSSHERCVTAVVLHTEAWSEEACFHQLIKLTVFFWRINALTAHNSHTRTVRSSPRLCLHPDIKVNLTWLEHSSCRAERLQRRDGYRRVSGLITLDSELIAIVWNALDVKCRSFQWKSH